MAIFKQYNDILSARYDKYKPFLPQGFQYESTGYSRLLVMRKSDGQFLANITMPPFFATHQVILRLCNDEDLFPTYIYYGIYT
jgi:hypothetical protein